MNVFARMFGVRRHEVPQPSEAEIAAVDVPRMLDQARERGDLRNDDEIGAALLLGADLTAERHPDEDLRRRAAAAAVATRDWLVARVGEERAAELLSSSLGPVAEDGSLPRQPRGRAATRALSPRYDARPS